MSSAEDLIRDNVYWEDPDQMIIVGTTEDGGFFVCDYNYYNEAVGDTLEEALRKLWGTDPAG